MTAKTPSRLLQFVDLLVQLHTPDAEPLTDEELAFMRAYRAQMLERALSRIPRAQN